MKKTNRPLTLTALLLSLFMAAMEMTVVSTAMPTVVGDLGGIELYAWVFTAYLVASTMMVPIFGKLSDLYGRKPILLTGIGIFLVGSAASGLSQTMLQLVIFRAFQGIGAGAMQPVVLTVIGDMYNLEERARVQGFTGGVWGFAGLVGPLLGGFIVQWLSWHWIFFINIPFGLLSAALIWRFLHEDIEKQRHELDIAGALLLGTAVLMLLLGASGGPLGGWPLILAAGLLAVFVAVEKRAPEPILPLDLFSNKVIALSSLAGVLIGGAMLATVTFVPLLVQAILQGSPTDAGRTITPMVLGWPLASAVAGRLVTRLGFRPMIRMGFTLTAVAATGLALVVAPGVEVLTIQIFMFVFGAGMGFANTALILAVQFSVGWRQRGVATASTMFFRTIGGSLAVGAFGGVITAALSRAENVPAGAATELLGPDHGASLAPEVLRSLSSALGGALEINFWATAGLAIAAFVVGMLFPKLSGQEAR